MGKADQRRQDKARAAAKADDRRRIVLRVYQGCDDAASRALGRLAERGITPTCSAGCAHCCRLEVPVSRAEAETLAAWLVENLDASALAAIRDRLRAWLAWYRSEYPRLVAAGIERADVFAKHAPSCALLVDGRCSAYPVRPITCRNHFVSSPPQVCADGGDPDVILDVSRAAYGAVSELRDLVARQGGNYLASVHLIAEWLAHLLEVEREPWVGAPPLQLS